MKEFGMRQIHNHCLYRHYKGNLYYVIGEARDVSGGKYDEMIVYHALYGNNELYVREKEEFLSEVPCGRWNPTSQEYRFELYQEVD